MRRAASVLLVALLTAGAMNDPLLAQRNGGANPRQGGPGPRAGGAPVDDQGGGRGRVGQGGFGRGRGNQVQGTSAIRGLVTAADTNTPLRRAQVTANASDIRATRAATTDATGRFELLNLPAGRWTVTASKGGFVSQQYGQRRAFESVDPITLADGQRMTANFTLPRGGVITGRITDEYGDAVTGARVEVLRSQMAQGRRRLTQVSVSSQTDDTGAFRVFGLAPGDYYISARQQPTPFDFGDGPMVLAATFYPGTTNVGDAQRIKVEASSEQSGINFALTSVGAVRVSGTVLDSNGAPAAATVMLQSASSVDGPFGPGMQGRSQADGTFTIRNVAPGEYTLDVMTGQGGRGGGGGGASIDVASMPLVVGSEDVSGLTITTSKGGAIRGTVVADGASNLPTANLQVSMQSLGGVFRGNGLASQVNTAG